MRITLKLLTGFSEYADGRVDSDNTMVVSEGATLENLLTVLEIPLDKPKVILVNKIARRLDYQLREGDEVSIFAFLVGG